MLALLPTIGALLGAPTTEIWRLLTVVPFGGGLALTPSFGGAILPVGVEDHENDLDRCKVAVRRNATFRAEGFQTIGRRIRRYVYGFGPGDGEDFGAYASKRESAVGERSFMVALLGMIALFVGAQAGMIVVEQGGVIRWWCISRWWMHLWYSLGEIF